MANGRRSALDSLPTELVDCILGDLSLDDLRNLRLVSHGVNIAASSEHFKSFCRTKTVVLRAPALAGLKDRITPGSIACNLQLLTITGVLSITSSLEKILRTKTEPADYTGIFGIRRGARGEQTHVRPRRVPLSPESLVKRQREYEALRTRLEQAVLERSLGRDFAALVELFRRLRQHGVLHGLHSITLEVAVERFLDWRSAPRHCDAWRPICETAAHTFQTTMRALAAAELPLQRLDAFTGFGMCSLTSFDIGSMLYDNSADLFDGVLRDIRSFSICTSQRVQLLISLAIDWAIPNRDDEVYERRAAMSDQDWQELIAQRSTVDEAEWEATAAGPRDTTGLAQLLAKMPRLLHLGLLNSQLPYRVFDAFHTPEWGKTRFADLVCASGLQRLSSITLCNHTADHSDLLAFLEANPYLEAVEFCDVSLYGSWQPVFDYLTNSQNRFTRLGFGNLFESTTTGTSYPIVVQGTPGGSAPAAKVAFVAEGREAVLRGVTYRQSELWPLPCALHSMRRQEKRARDELKVYLTDDERAGILAMEDGVPDDLTRLDSQAKGFPLIRLL
ncbi:hypothetical protein LTR29_013622 [Friedmanniomyces endolithicus]|nr:hypothetical protein LTR29_013622 [Friedmanniomyces endolithicus]